MALTSFVRLQSRPNLDSGMANTGYKSNLLRIKFVLNSAPLYAVSACEAASHG